MGFPILVRCHLYIEPAPWTLILYVSLNKLLNKQPNSWWFEMPVLMFMAWTSIVNIHDQESVGRPVSSSSCRYITELGEKWTIIQILMIFVFSVWETKYLEHSPENGCPWYVLYKIPLAWANYLLAQLKMHWHWQGASVSFPHCIS